MVKERWPVIDTHYHTGVCLINTFDAEKELIPWMDKNGVDIQVIFQVNEGFVHKTPDWNPYIGNDYISRIQHKFPDRVIGLCTINPWLQAPKTYNWPKSKYGKEMDLPIRDEALEELERSILELGLWGIKLHPLEHDFEINNKSIIYPIMEKLTRLQEKCGRKLFVVVHCAGDSVNNTPTQLAQVAADFPDILFLMAHAGYMRAFGTAGDVAEGIDNLKLDLTLNVTPTTLKPTYEKEGAGKFVIGTDGPFDLATTKRLIVRDLTGEDDEEAVELVMGGNMAEYLGIPKIKYEEQEGREPWENIAGR
ncbi:amidohydrolase family protein [[Clostridium] hylemonae]|uniref:amidohydrolase family protein n=1 Tax=[Clostridium] hylemonae TaxID=89153 RepID=UPI0011063C73|nr:amidohydrolase family protein [[Clostridium] hylemonae]